jgi:hypothetical protein
MSYGTRLSKKSHLFFRVVVGNDSTLLTAKTATMATSRPFLFVILILFCVVGGGFASIS